MEQGGVFVDVTPAMAQEMLRFVDPVKQRTLSRATVKDYAARMRGGHWKVTHLGIGFDVDGNLTDGQHRLHAVVETGMTQRMMVTRGLDRDASDGFDDGRPRNPGDKLRAPPRIADVCNMAAGYFNIRGKVPAQLLHKMHSVLGRPAALLLAQSHANKVFFSAASIRLAASLRMIEGGDAEYILNLYGMLCRFDTQNPALPTIGHAFLKMHGRGDVSAHDRQRCLALGLYVFEQANSRYKQMRPDIGAAGDAVRAAIGNALQQRAAQGELLALQASQR